MMKFTMPILALVVAILLVASQSIYTVDQAKYAVLFQLGEIVETKILPGLYFKVPLVQNVRFYDNRNLTLENSEPDRVTTSEKTPLLVDFIVLWRINDVRQYYVSVKGDEEAALRRLSQTVRSNLAEEFNKRTMHDAISSERDRITAVTRQKADADAKTIGVEVVDVRLRRIELPPDVTGPVYQRMESERGILPVLQAVRVGPRAARARKVTATLRNRFRGGRRGLVVAGLCVAVDCRGHPPFRRAACLARDVPQAHRHE